MERLCVCVIVVIILNEVACANISTEPTSDVPDQELPERTPDPELNAQPETLLSDAQVKSIEVDTESSKVDIPGGEPIRVSLKATTTDPIEECLLVCFGTPEHNPVCGTDYVTYLNPSRLRCAQNCGIDVKLMQNGYCPSTAAPITTTTISTSSSSATPTSTPEPGRERECIRACPVTPEYNPVCGSNHVQYTNIGRLLCAKKCGVDVTLMKKGRCPTISTTSTTTERTTTTARVPITTPEPSVVRECISACPVTSEYNPVCGSNYVQYANPGRLMCAYVCGVDVTIMTNGRCPATTTARPVTTTITTTTTNPITSTTMSSKTIKCISACPVTNEYNPVCGSDNVTYSNPGKLSCAKNCGVDVSLRRRGPCPTMPTTHPPFNLLSGSM